MEKVTVIGGGNGAFATAADLTIRGNQVTLFELPRFAAGLSEVIEKGGIEMEAYANNGLTGGFAKLHKITTDIGEACRVRHCVHRGSHIFNGYDRFSVCSASARWADYRAYAG